MTDGSIPITSIPDNFFLTLESEYAKARYCGIDITLFFIKLWQEHDLALIHGISTADRILAEIQQLIGKNIRHGDRVFQYGNDGFMVILPHTPKGHADSVIVKIRALIDEYANRDDSGTSQILSPRFGVSSYPQDAQEGRE
jgi:diguanylate cyclase (GGDEF)-like protein